MAMQPGDLMMALGGGSSGADKAEKQPAKGSGSSYLAGKPPKLKAHLMDAVDPSLSQEERAEALCRAMDEFSGDEEQGEEESSASAPSEDSEEYPAEY